MAIIYGESGAWADIVQSLRAKSLNVSHPQDLPLLLETLKRQHSLGLAPLQQEFERELEKISERRKVLIEEFRKNAALVTYDIDVQIKWLEAEHNQRTLLFWLRNLLTAFIPALFKAYRLRRLKYKRTYAINLLHQDIQRQEKDYFYGQNNREQIIQEQFNKLASNIHSLEQIPQSKEFAGASAELQVIECLKTLPNDYHVCNDVRLKANRRIRFEGEYLLSAQIDHLVVGPSGVFVIEVKNWSRKFIEQQNYFDPFQQVARASYLCFDSLRYAFPGGRVRSIIVNCGVLPSSSKNHHVKVVSPSELRGYIAWRHQPVVSSETARELVKLLCEH